MRTADILSIVRYAAAFGGGILVKNGAINANEVETIIGIATGLAAMVASQIARVRQRKAARAADPNHTDL